jgi:hypothetical protein
MFLKHVEGGMFRNTKIEKVFSTYKAVCVRVNYDELDGAKFLKKSLLGCLVATSLK